MARQGSSQYDNGNYDNALKYYNKSIEIDPSFDRAWYDKGLALNKKGKYLQTIPCFDRAIDLNSRMIIIGMPRAVLSTA